MSGSPCAVSTKGLMEHSGWPCWEPPGPFSSSLGGVNPAHLRDCSDGDGAWHLPRCYGGQWALNPVFCGIAGQL